MSLGVRTFSFAFGIGIGGVFIATALTKSWREFEETLFFAMFFSAMFAGFSMLSAWVGFGLAERLGHCPSKYYAATLGVLFVGASAGLAWIIGIDAFLKSLDGWVIPGLIFLGAPVFAFAGAVLSRKPC